MEITKNENNYLLKNSKGEYHLSIEDYEKLGEKEAIILAEKEINKKLNANYSNKTINFEKARDLGFCEFGIKDFCKRLDLDIDKTYKLLELKEKLTLDVMFGYIYEVVRLFGKEVFKEKELEISKDAKYSYWYARDVLKKPFKLGEKEISKNAKYSYRYTRDILKKPFKLGEKAISKDSCYSYYYALNVLEKPFKLGEGVISKDDNYSYWYAKDVLKKPFKLGEEVISKNYHYSHYYALNVLKKPFYLNGKLISTGDLDEHNA